MHARTLTHTHAPHAHTHTHPSGRESTGIAAVAVPRGAALRPGWRLCFVVRVRVLCLRVRGWVWWVGGWVGGFVAN